MYQLGPTARPRSGKLLMPLFKKRKRLSCQLSLLWFLAWGSESFRAWRNPKPTAFGKLDGGANWRSAWVDRLMPVEENDTDSTQYEGLRHS